MDAENFKRPHRTRSRSGGPPRAARVFAALLALALGGAPAAGAQEPHPPPAEPPRPIEVQDLLKGPRQTPVVKLRTVVLDPGHGGRDTGVRGDGGIFEKDVALETARRLSDALRSRLGVRVVLTRTDDYPLPLLERTSIANNVQGQLFISLHAGGDFRRAAGGAGVFVLGPPPPARPAADAPPGGSAVQSWDTAQWRFLEESGRFARLAADALSKETGLAKNPVREAPLLVLKGARMPAVVVSLGNLTNPREEALLEKEEFLEKAAQGLFQAVQRFILGEDAVR